MPANDNLPNKKAVSRRMLVILSLVVVGMFAFGFALVPLYNVFCDLTGLNGKTNTTAVANSANIIDKSRTISVQFVTTTNANLPWKFYPLTHSIKIHPGENVKINFYAENDSNHKMTVQAVPSVTPGPAAKYLLKTECFCFNQQTLNSGGKIKMPVLFHIDRQLPKDINTITLAYTMFDVTDKKFNRNRNKPRGKLTAAR